MAVTSFDIRRLSINMEPEISFVGGFSILNVEKSIGYHYYKNQWYAKETNDDSSILMNYSLGVKINIGLSFKYELNQRFSFAILPYFSRLWSTVFQNTDQDPWIVSGINGDEYEVRLNSLVYGTDFRIYITKKRRN